MLREKREARAEVNESNWCTELNTKMIHCPNPGSIQPCGGHWIMSVQSTTCQQFSPDPHKHLDKTSLFVMFIIFFLFHFVVVDMLGGGVTL